VSFWLQHLPVLPIVIPLVAAATMLLFAESRRRVRLLLALAAGLGQLAVACSLVYLTTDAVPDIWPEGIGTYSIGGWQAPFGIVLVVDRLSALMVALNALLALPVLVYSIARSDRLGVHYHPLFQFLLMGLNGAFLTGDVFNLFVFFEILLAASYALLLHGAGTRRVRNAFHFIVVNLCGSFTFLIGVAMIYSVVGTLNLADIAARWSALPAGDRGIAEAGAAILSIAFLVKAASWPLNFWLPGAYTAAHPSVAAVFSITTKVGVYAILRLASLLEYPVAPLGGTWLFYGAIVTMVFGIAGILAARQLSRIAAFSIILTSGTMLAAIGLAPGALVAPALFYMVGSVLATGALFMLTGMTERMRTMAPDNSNSPSAQPVTYSAFRVGEPPDPHPPDAEVGVAIPAAMAFLGLAFICCALLISGMPPLAGFIGKLALISATFEALSAGGDGLHAGVLIFVLLVGGFAGLIAMCRIGMRLFWSVTGRTTPRLRIIEAGPVAFLILLGIGLTVGAGPVFAYIDSTARALSDPQVYIRAVLTDTPGNRP
jgi:multicomponent K+:H+ antiporter subunit D